MELKQLHKESQELVTGFAESRIGGRAENQDSFGAKETALGFLVTVCDGMGGGPGGKTASTIAVAQIIAGVEEANGEETIPNILIKAVRRANMAIIEAGNETPALRGMGSTATVLLINERAAYVAHVGDSRVYQFRGHRKVFRTFDHSVVFDLVKQGVITEEQARLSAQSNIITRALGIQPDVEVDVAELPYERGDRFLLCSDGIHGTMPEAELIRKATNHKQVLGALTDDIATAVDNSGRTAGGGHDNLTLALIETKKTSKLKPRMSKINKLTLLVLAVACAASICLNIIQCSGKTAADSDATAMEALRSRLMNDSLVHAQDSIKMDALQKENREMTEKIERSMQVLKNK